MVRRAAAAKASAGGGSGSDPGDGDTGARAFLLDDDPAPNGGTPTLLFALLGTGLLIAILAFVVFAGRTATRDEAAITAYIVLGFALAVGYLIFLFAVGVWLVRDAYHRSHEGALWAMLYAVPHLAFLAFAPGVPFFWFMTPSRAAFFGSFVLWIVAIVFWLALSWSGFILYWLTRRPGDLDACLHCPGSRQPYARRCPHCGHE